MRDHASDRSAPATPPTDPAASARAALETVVLPAREGATPSSAPPVEIYLGTEPAQYRANRVFGWSIERARDPGREVRIHLMSELPGFDRRFWTTGFTNYRFAIPALQGGVGRAIYNDEDQIYLSDPGALFDLDLGGAGYLSISDTESSVMLIDCARMAPVWTLEEARKGWKRSLLRQATKATGLRGDLDPHWNARDEEFVPGRSHLLHYTTLHTQPWRPFPERFVYQAGAYTDLWHDLEREAIAAGFELFDATRPSRGFRELVERLGALPASELGSGISLAGELSGAVEALVRRTKSATLLELQPDLRGDERQTPGRFGLDSERRLGLLEWLHGLDGDEVFDGVLCVEGLEALPVWDVPWVVDTLFRRARRFVFAAVRTPEAPPRRRFLRPPQGTTGTEGWWRSHFEAAAARHPGVSWELIAARGRAFESDRIVVRSGGPRPDETPPRVWTLDDGRPGNAAQVEALATALGWPTRHFSPRLGALSALPFLEHGAHRLGLVDPEADGLTPPWPELLIVAGRRVAPLARWIRARAAGRTRVVALGPRAATPADAVDLAVTPRGADLFPHPNRIEIDRPLVPTRSVPDAWRERLAAIPGRKLLLVIGSGTDRLGLDARAAEALGRLVRESAAGLGASVLVSASRRADPVVVEGCLRGLGRVAFVHRETRAQQPAERPWPALLEAADLFVMAGLGETTLAELCETGKPLFLSPQHEGARPLWPRLRDAITERVARRARARPENDRGTVRPQEGLELLAARALERGWLRPKRDIEALRGRLVRAGQARLLRAPIRAGDLESFVSPPESEIPAVVARVRALVGMTPPDTTRAGIDRRDRAGDDGGDEANGHADGQADGHADDPARSDGEG